TFWANASYQFGNLPRPIFRFAALSSRASPLRRTDEGSAVLQPCSPCGRVRTTEEKEPAGTLAFPGKPSRTCEEKEPARCRRYKNRDQNAKNACRHLLRLERVAVVCFQRVGACSDSVLLRLEMACFG